MKKIILGVTVPESCILLEGQLKFLHERGFDVYFITGYSDAAKLFCEKEMCTFVPVFMRREISLWEDIKAFFLILRIIYRIKPDVVNFGTPKMGLLGMLAACLLRVERRIYTCRGFRFEREYGFKKKVLLLIEKIVGKCANRIICISSSLKDMAIRENIFSSSKVLIINKGSSNGINLNLFSTHTVEIEKKREITIKYHLDHTFVYGFVGRICNDKGVSELYQAFDQLYLQNNNLRLIIVGKVNSDNLKEKSLLNTIKEHPGIIYLGTFPKMELPTYMSLFDVFVLPTKREGFGNVLIEAAALGIPVITTDATGSRDAIKDYYNGRLVPVENVEALKTMMLLFYEDEKLRKCYGENGRAWVKNFSRDLIWQEQYNLYVS